MSAWPRTPGWERDPERVVRWLAISAYQAQAARSLWWRWANFGLSWELTDSPQNPPRAGTGWDLVGSITAEQAWQVVEGGADTVIRRLAWSAEEAIEAAGR